MGQLKWEFHLSSEVFEIDQLVVEKAHQALESDSSIRSLLPCAPDCAEVTLLKDLAKNITSKFTDIVIIATGASSNIPRMVFELQTPSVRVHFLENLESYKIRSTLQNLDLSKTCFLSITKSGNTLEVVAILDACIKWARQSFDSSYIKEHFYFLIGKGKTLVRDVAQNYDAIVIDLPSTSGRFSFFSPVGLLACALSGFDVEKILEFGKKHFDILIKEGSILREHSEFLMSMSHHYTSHVFLGYSERFSGMNTFIRQLVAESIGKNATGFNPYTAIGAIDHHSQIQLYLDGPDDKFFTIFAPIHDQKDLMVDHPVHGYISVDTLLLAQAETVIDALKLKHKNIRLFMVQKLNEEFLAQIVMTLMLETILFARIHNMNPFDQPAVEDMKKILKTKLEQENV